LVLKDKGNYKSVRAEEQGSLDHDGLALSEKRGFGGPGLVFRGKAGLGSNPCSHPSVLLLVSLSYKGLFREGACNIIKENPAPIIQTGSFPASTSILFY
jgi:hypothetical protein